MIYVYYLDNRKTSLALFRPRRGSEQPSDPVWPSGKALGW